MQEGFPQGRGQAETMKSLLSQLTQQGRLSQSAALLSHRHRALEHHLSSLPTAFTSLSDSRQSPNSFFPPTLFSPCLSPTCPLPLATPLPRAGCMHRGSLFSVLSDRISFWEGEAVPLFFLNEKLTYGKASLFPRFLTYFQSKDWKVDG